MIPKLLKQPYPFTQNWKRIIRSSFLFGFFVFAFLYFFQPFGLNNYTSEDKTFVLAGYGLVTTLSLFLMSGFAFVFLPNWYTSKSWTVGKNILFTTLTFLLIGSANLLYSNWMGFLKLSWSSFLFFQSVTLAVGFFPVTLSTFLVYNRKLKAAVEEATSLNENLFEGAANHDLIEIPSKNKSEELKVSADHLLAIKAEENYIEVLISSSQQLEKKVLRNTLKGAEDALMNLNHLQRCHRSYLVNLEKVKNFSGNAQGLSLKLDVEEEILIPVSRNYVKKIKAALNS